MLGRVPNPVYVIRNIIFNQRTLTYFARGSITVQLTSCLTCLDSAVLLNLNYQQICLFGQILTGGQLYSDTSTHKVSEFPLYLTNHRTYEDLSDSFVELEGSVGEG